MTEAMPDKNNALEKEVLESGEINQSPNVLKSPMGSFLFLSSEQNSEGRKITLLSL